MTPNGSWDPPDRPPPGPDPPGPDLSGPQILAEDPFWGTFWHLFDPFLRVRPENQALFEISENRPLRNDPKMTPNGSWDPPDRPPPGPDPPDRPPPGPDPPGPDLSGPRILAEGPFWGTFWPLFDPFLRVRPENQALFEISENRPLRNDPKMTPNDSWDPPDRPAPGPQILAESPFGPFWHLFGPISEHPFWHSGPKWSNTPYIISSPYKPCIELCRNGSLD
jgi:hypothetical protein